MDKQKTQRIIGILVIIAFVIVLIPLFFGKSTTSTQLTSRRTLPLPGQSSPVTLVKNNQDEGQTPEDSVVLSAAESANAGASQSAAPAGQEQVEQNNAATDNAPTADGSVLNISGGEGPANTGEQTQGNPPVSVSPSTQLQSNAPSSMNPTAQSQGNASSSMDPTTTPSQDNTSGSMDPMTQSQDNASSATDPAAQPQDNGQPSINPIAQPQGDVPSSMNPGIQPQDNASQPHTQSFNPSMDKNANGITNASDDLTPSDNTSSRLSAENGNNNHAHPKYKIVTVAKHSHSKVHPKNLSNEELAKLTSTAWAVQMGNFKDKNNAHRLTDKLRAAGYNAFTKEIKSANGSVSTRVYIGPEFKQASAVKLADRVEQTIKMRGIIVSIKPLDV